MTALSKKIKAKFSRSAEILEIINCFENCTLPLSEWNRNTFLTIVYCYLYLNPLAEAEKLMNCGVKRYRFENGLSLMPPASLGKTKLPQLFRQISQFIKLHKNRKSFVELANLVLEIKELK